MLLESGKRRLLSWILKNWRAIVSEKLFVIIKNGLYWRPNSRGYTGSRLEAGLYTEEEAKDICGLPRSECRYKPVYDLFDSEDEVSEIIAHLEKVKEQIYLNDRAII